MKLTLRSQPHAAGILLALLAAAAILWAWSFFGQAAAGARRAAEDLAACQRLEQEILALKDRPRQAQAAALQQPELARRIEAAAGKAGLDPRQIERIAPGEAHRLQDSVFLETPTQIKLSHVTLGRLVPFLHHLSVDESGGRALRVDVLRLGTPPGAEAGASWSAEITVCYLVYAPKPEGGRAVPD